MIAGPNGSGKTTLTERLRAAGFDLGEYINADDISVGLAGDSADVSREAQRLAEERRQSCLARGVSFSFETVMSHPSKIELLHQARALGYFIQLFFVGVEDPRINVDRVAQRVALGGHDVPIVRIIQRLSARWPSSPRRSTPLTGPCSSTTRIPILMVEPSLL